MGEAACKLLIERIRQPLSAANQHKQVPFQIMERESVVEFSPAA